MAPARFQVRRCDDSRTGAGAEARRYGLLAIVLFGRGTPAMAQGICRHWVALGLLPSAACTDTAGAGMPAFAPAIDALGWSLSKGIAIAAAALPPKAVVLWLTVLPILGLATLAVGGMASRSIAEGRPSEGFFNWLSRPAATIALLFFLLPLLLPAPPMSSRTTMDAGLPQPASTTRC